MQFKIILVFMYSMGCMLSVTAQSIQPMVIASSGTYFTVSPAKLSFTLGEPLIETVNSSSVIVTQGFHQPSSTTTQIGEIKPELNATIWPNPVSSEVTIELVSFKPPLKLTLYDLAGKLILSFELKTAKTKLLIDYLPVGTYLLILTPNSGLSRAFKLHKSN